jgi:DNA-binding LacI/PurR family transcriptional regulator
MSFKRTRRVTLKEVADKLNVSSATVSNAFNRPSQLSLELREDILQMCRVMGYRGPRIESRQFRTRKTNTIAMMISEDLAYSLSDSGVRKALQGVCQILDPLGYNLVLVPSSDHELKRLSGLEQFIEGFIVYGQPSEYCLKQLIYYQKSIITIDINIEGYASVNIDNYKAAYNIASVALALHPKNITILGLKISHQAETKNAEQLGLIPASESIMTQRLDGFKAAGATKGVNINNANIWNIPEDSDFLAYETAKYVLKQEAPPDLLLCMSDRIALNAMQAAQDLGISIPSKLMVTGFGDIEEAAAKSLTTVSDPSFEKGIAAAKMLIGRREEAKLIFEAPMINRSTCRKLDSH